MMNQDNTENPAGAPEEHTDSGPASESVSQKAEMEHLREEVRSLQDKYLRQAADLENYRRRSEREKAELLKFANENLVKDLLPVLDSFNQAIGSQPEDSPGSAGVREGVQMVRQQFLAALRKHGLEEVVAVGERFDPNVHQAIQRIEDPACEQETVAQEFAKGYVLNGRLVRAAMVSVTVPSK